MTGVAILGATGMLGSMLLDFFVGQPGIALIATVRQSSAADVIRKTHPEVDVRLLDAECASAADVGRAIAGANWSINAIGLIKQRINDANRDHVERAVRLNALFALELARAAERAGSHVIQVATDCVYSGKIGGYTEAAPHDCDDVYGKTKSLGEVASPAVLHLRCSIIGPERGGAFSLLNWFLARQGGDEISGYANHLWNGITTLHFARLCAAMIAGDHSFATGIQHVVPADHVTKDALLRLFATAFSRPDIIINRIDAPNAIDRTLATRNAAGNRQLWAAAGYPTPPTIGEMVAELAARLHADSQISRGSQK